MVRPAPDPPPLLRVLLAGMAPWRAQLVRDYLAADAGLIVVGHAAGAAQALAATATLSPDVVLLDFDVDGHSGLETTRRLRAASPATKVVLLGDDGGDEDGAVYQAAARAAGACAYLPWLVSRPALLAAIHTKPAGASCSAGV